MRSFLIEQAIILYLGAIWSHLKYSESGMKVLHLI